jgi:hypothetical protein
MDENYCRFQDYSGTWKSGQKNGPGTLKVCLDGVFFFGGDNGRNDKDPNNEFFKFEFTKEGSRFIQLPKFATPRSCASSVAVGHFLYLLGGYNGKYSISNVERFDILNGKWDIVSSLSERRASHSSIAYQEKIYVFGGVKGAKAFHEIDCYDTLTNTWKTISNLHYGRSGCGVVLYEKKVYIFGGIQVKANLPLEIYDLETNQVKVQESIVVDLHSFGISLVFHEEVPYILLAGGGVDTYPTNRTYLYNIVENTLETVQPLHSKRQYLKLFQQEGSVYAIGGYDGKNIVQTTEAFDFKHRRWVTQQSFFPYCGCAIFQGKMEATIEGTWKNNVIDGKVILNNKWKGTLLKSKKHGLFENIETQEAVYFFEDFIVSFAKFTMLQRLKRIKIPENFLCPISYELLLDPVVTSSGNTYDRKSIMKWLSFHQTDPLTRENISVQVIPNNLLKKIIIEFLETKRIHL